MAEGQAEIIVTDTSVLLNFIKVGRMDLVDACAFTVLVTDHVAAEITDQYPAQQKQFSAAINGGVIKQVSIDDPDEVAIFGSLIGSGRLGAGECSAIALAANRDYCLAIDDRRAANEAQRTAKNLKILTTQDLVVSMIHEGLLEICEADAIKEEWERNHRFSLKIGTFGDVV
ncbi:hypothetical protein [Amorphus sp. 3PC139-8]|uniref:hypothetical protein n=1 Tax=Amorphus sp. 3PC139-8 TaxID=2735676 RepID=UPI00345CCEC0